MRVLITGGAGLVAGHLLAAAPDTAEVHVTWRHRRPPSGHPAHRAHLTHLDNAGEVSRLFDRAQPDVVVHTAYSPARRADIVAASENVARECARRGVDLVHLSSDTVFDGEHPPYLEADHVAPVSDYGRWKAEAEAAVLDALPDACITRSSLIVSLDPPDGSTRWLLDEVRAGRQPTLFHDEVRSALRAEDLANTIWALAGEELSARRGIWHLPGPEDLSRLELGRRLLIRSGLDPDSVKVGSVRDHPSPRPRDLTLRSRRVVPGPSPSPVG